MQHSADCVVALIREGLHRIRIRPVRDFVAGLRSSERRKIRYHAAKHTHDHFRDVPAAIDYLRRKIAFHKSDRCCLNSAFICPHFAWMVIQSLCQSGCCCSQWHSCSWPNSRGTIRTFDLHLMRVTRWPLLYSAPYVHPALPELRFPCLKSFSGDYLAIF